MSRVTRHAMVKLWEGIARVSRGVQGHTFLGYRQLDRKVLARTTLVEDGTVVTKARVRFASRREARLPRRSPLAPQRSVPAVPTE